METQPRQPRAKLAAALCAGLLIVFYLLAWQAVQTKSATIDEPLHAAGAYFHVFDRDYRVNPEDPPLWNYWAMLPHRRDSLVRDPDEPLYQKQLENVAYEFVIAIRLMYQVGNDGAAFINRSRAAMLLIGVAVGAVTAIWSWKLAGATAAVASCTLLAFDPNFLAHSPLIKNDVAISLVLLGLAFAAWSAGKRARWSNILLVSALCGVGAAVKFSGVLCLPILGLLLLARALLPDAWIFLGRELRTRGARVLAATGVCASAAALTILIIWGSYLFRFDPTPTPGVTLNMGQELRKLRETELFVANSGKWPTTRQIDAHPLPLMGRVIQFAERHRLLPQSWLYGFLFTYRSTLTRPTYLLGERSEMGWWYYFPLAMLFKTPMATIAAGGIALFALVKNAKPQAGRRWDLACISIPFVIYGMSAITSNLNLGLRHVLPLYPFIYILTAMGMSRLLVTHRRAFAPIAVVLTVALLVESLAAFPHYLSFFNAPSRSYRLHLLSDSNLDWGQDLLYVAEWQQRNPSTPLYLGYLGSVDPAVYGIRYTNIPGGFVMNTNWEWPPSGPGVIAISAMLLQGVNCPPSCIEFYAPLRARAPRQILGDTIYLYDWPLR